MPGVAAVGGLEQTAVASVDFVVVFPRAFARFPHRGIHDIWIGGIELHVGTASVIIFRNHFLPGLSAVSRAVDAALRARPVGMAEHRGKHTVRVARIDCQPRYLLAVAQAFSCRTKVRPSLAGIGGLVDAVAD